MRQMKREIAELKGEHIEDDEDEEDDVLPIPTPQQSHQIPSREHISPLDCKAAEAAEPDEQCDRLFDKICTQLQKLIEDGQKAISEVVSRSVGQPEQNEGKPVSILGLVESDDNGHPFSGHDLVVQFQEPTIMKPPKLSASSSKEDLSSSLSSMPLPPPEAVRSNSPPVAAGRAPIPAPAPDRIRKRSSDSVLMKKRSTESVSSTSSRTSTGSTSSTGSSGHVRKMSSMNPTTSSSSTTKTTSNHLRRRSDSHLINNSKTSSNNNKGSGNSRTMRDFGPPKITAVLGPRATVVVPASITANTTIGRSATRASRQSLSGGSARLMRSMGMDEER
ncbi:hypothetical protein HK102_001207 [Quaeritorhiza haematococci]|nr:hypothetical protein HK102_001207 [Quaeritorhiza haematococci]